MSGKQPCPKCGAEMKEISQYRHVFRPDPETMTEGQLAEQFAAEMGGAFEEGIHGFTSHRYRCEKCGEETEKR